MTKDTQPMRKSAQYATLDRPKSNQPKKMTKRRLALLVAIAASATLPVGALAAPEIASPVTQYDRQMEQSSDAGQKPGGQQGRRIEPWERLDMTQEVDAIQGLDAEIGSSGVSIQDAQADHLFNRMKDDPEWLTLKGQVDNYANREEDLEFRVDRLENLDYNWEPAGTLASEWNLLGATPTGSWSPAISNQTTNFTQTIDRVLFYNKKLEEQKRNIVTGEIKTVKESYITKTENDTISRNINVTLGGWTNTGGLHSCTTWSPATSTKPQGTEFTQSRTCKQNQQRNVSYTVASTGENPGGAWTDTRTIDVDQTRSATGTKATTGEWFLAGAIAVNSPNIDSDPYFFHDGYSQSHWNGAPTYYSPNDAPWLNTETNRACQPLGDKFVAVLPMGPQGYRRILFVVCR